MKLALIQTNPHVANLEGNAARIEAAVLPLAGQVALCVTCEMSLTGYPPRDLLLTPEFVSDARRVLDALAERLRMAPPTLVGFPAARHSRDGRPLHNAAALLDGGQVRAVFAKSLLPTYDVFDEDRYFEPGSGAHELQLGSRSAILTICEDVWNDADFWTNRRYHLDPLAQAAHTYGGVILNMSASPFWAGKQQLRESMLQSLARKHRRPVVYVNQVGGNDDLLFDGRSVAIHADGRVLGRAASFAEDVLVVDVDGGGEVPAFSESVPAEIFAGLVLGTKDYVRKCGFSKVLLGLSGGVDSALTAVVAVRALGPTQVRGILMPAPFSSAGSIDDSLELARVLGIETQTIPIGALQASYHEALRPAVADVSDLTDQNLQARIRGQLLMALANETGALLLTTGNKSELAVGYCTLYGDMCGALAVIGDVYKTQVYEICRWLNRSGVVIPEAILTKAPSAELKPNQTDQDTLPPYDVLDRVLVRLVEGMRGPAALIDEGFDAGLVHEVATMMRRAEFKRRQAAPALKVSERAFGTGWRMPIARGVWGS